MKIKLIDGSYKKSKKVYLALFLSSIVSSDVMAASADVQQCKKGSFWNSALGVCQAGVDTVRNGVKYVYNNAVHDDEFGDEDDELAPKSSLSSSSSDFKSPLSSPEQTNVFLVDDDANLRGSLKNDSQSPLQSLTEEQKVRAKRTLDAFKANVERKKRSRENYQFAAALQEQGGMVDAVNHKSADDEFNRLAGTYDAMQYQSPAEKLKADWDPLPGAGSVDYPSTYDALQEQSGMVDAVNHKSADEQGWDSLPLNDVINENQSNTKEQRTKTFLTQQRNEYNPHTMALNTKYTPLDVQVYKMNPGFESFSDEQAKQHYQNYGRYPRFHYFYSKPKNFDWQNYVCMYEDVKNDFRNGLNNSTIDNAEMWALKKFIHDGAPMGRFGGFGHALAKYDLKWTPDQFKEFRQCKVSLPKDPQLHNTLADMNNAYESTYLYGSDSKSIPFHP